MRIAICDDQKIERCILMEALHSILEDYSTDEFDNGSALLKSHARDPYDLIFLDILMPGRNGMDTAATIRTYDKKTPIIFLSSSEEFGVQSYRVLAFDYLLKPIDREQLRDCMKRLFSQTVKKKHFLTITYKSTEVDILLSNIQCLESNSRKVILTLSENNEIEVSGKLTDFEPFLLEHDFCRCHKSYLVNMEHIDKLESDMFYLTCGKSVKISRAFLRSAKKSYFEYTFHTN